MEDLQDKEIWERMIKISPDAVCMLDREGFILCVNEAYQHLIGYEREEIIGRQFKTFIHPEDLMDSLKVFQDVINGFKTPSFENRYIHKKGQEVTFSWSAVWSVKDGVMLCLGRDITEQTMTRQKLRQKDELNHTMVEHGSDMLSLFDEELNFLYCGGSVFRELGYMPEQLVGTNVLGLVHPVDIPMIKESLIKTLASREKLDVPEFRFKHANGEWRWIETRASNQLKNPFLKAVVASSRDVTEKVENKLKLQESEQRFRSLFEANPDLVALLDAKGFMIDVNPAVTSFIGKEKQEIINLPISDFLPLDVLSESNDSRQGAAKRTVHFETYCERLDKWLQVKAFPSEERWSVFIDDITERVKSEKVMEKLSLVASKTINGIIIMDGEGRTEWVNEGFTKVTGYSFSEISGKYPGALFDGEETDPAASNRIREKLKKDKPFTEEILSYKKSGEKVWISLNFTPILNDAGQVLNFIALQTDITFRKETEASQLQLTDDLYKQNNNLQQFTYMVSHNLRSPLSGAMGLVDLLPAIDKSSEDFNDLLVNLKGTIYKMDSVLKDLNRILSAQDIEGTADKEMVSLASLCQQAMEEQQESLRKCGGEVYLNIEEGLSVWGNKAYLEIIFHNLFSNAIKYRFPERALKVEIQCFRNKGKGLTISFSDNGLGFDRKLAGENLFKLYKRFHSHLEGRGIGLFLIKSHVEAMGGQIEVDSKINVGTKFLINLKCN